MGRPLHFLIEHTEITKIGKINYKKLVGKLASHPSVLMKDDSLYFSNSELFSTVFTHFTRFLVSAPGPVQLTSAYVKLSLHKFVCKLREKGTSRK